jgi:N-acetylated-alpha-linked acidic dipeptidase
MRALRIAVLLSTCLPVALAAQAPRRPAASLDSILLNTPDTAMARRHSVALATRVHVAGTPAQESTATYVLRQMASWGLDTARNRFRVYLPAPEFVAVERLTPERLQLPLSEPRIEGDASTEQPAWPTVNGYSGAGDVTGPIVYVNYGLPADYAVLDSLGVSVQGAIAIARYGRSHRGIKVREAQRRGAVGIILYSDPADDGFGRGDVYPDGTWRPAGGVQRGSVKLSPGDPATPGYAAVRGAHRIPLDSMDIPKIPSVPMGYGNAVELLKGLAGPISPTNWRGGLPVDYRLGGTAAVTARVTVRLETGEAAYKTISNTFGTIRGSTWPDEVIIIGGHRDAWGPGAADNVSGTTSVLEAARAWSEAVRQGLRPRRTLVFATWDAEEWGLIGSSEYAESRETTLRRNAVAYLNQDMVATGRAFGGSAAPTLRGLVRRAAAKVPAFDGVGSTYDLWRRQQSTAAGQEPTMGNLGGGSDFAGFYNHLGIPSAEWGFGGGQGIYHSHYDDLAWMDRYGDPGYIAHRAAAQIGAFAMAELANADVLPYDHAELGRVLARLATAAQDSAGKLGLTGAPFERLIAAGNAIGQAATVLYSVSSQSGRPPVARLTRANAELREAERRLARPTGLVGRPWYRNLVYAADRDNGYAEVPLPGIAEALRDKDQARLATEVADLAMRAEEVAARITAATRLLRR